MGVMYQALTNPFRRRLRGFSLRQLVGGAGQTRGDGWVIFQPRRDHLAAGLSLFQGMPEPSESKTPSAGPPSLPALKADGANRRALRPKAARLYRRTRAGNSRPNWVPR